MTGVKVLTVRLEMSESEARFLREQVGRMPYDTVLQEIYAVLSTVLNSMEEEKKRNE